MKAKIDYAFLGLLGVLMAIAIVDILTSDYVFNINNYLGFIGWSVALVIRIVKPHLGRYVVAWLIALGPLNILSFELVRTSVSMGFGSVSTPGVNPEMLLILVAFYLINRKSINGKIAQTFKGSAEEQEIKHQKMVDFYLTRFTDLSSDEFEAIFKKN
ncbi:MAG: hypothetical protein V4592_26070 [Bacteroidota bacterium]